MPPPVYAYYYGKSLQKLKPNPAKIAVYASSAQVFKNVAVTLDDYAKKKVSVQNPLGPVLVADLPFQTGSEVLRSKIPQEQYRAYPVFFGPTGGEVIVNGSWIVRFKPGFSSSQMAEICQKFDGKIESAVNKEERIYLVRYTKAPEFFFEQANALYNSDTVEYAYPNFINALVMEGAPVAPPGNNPLYTPNQNGLRSIKADLAWAFLSKTTKPIVPVKVAVLDEGIMREHQDFKDPVNSTSRVVNRFDKVAAAAGNTCPRSNNHHGTSVAGIIGAVNNSLNIIGVAFDAQLADVRVAYTSSQGTWISSDASIIAGIYDAIRNGVKVINISWSYNTLTSGIRNALVDALSNNIVVCCAAGNFTQNTSAARAIKFPALLAATTSVIAVGACHNDGNWIDLSTTTGFGSCFAPGSQVVTLCAPGFKIPTLRLAHQATTEFRGTSGAVAFVSGVAALVLSIKPGLTPAQVKTLLQTTAAPVPAGNPTIKVGSGMVDALRAVS